MFRQGQGQGMGTQVFLYQALPVIASMPALPCPPQSREKGAAQAAKKKGEGEELSSSPGKSRTQGRGLCKHLVCDKMWHCSRKQSLVLLMSKTQQRRAGRGAERAQGRSGAAQLRC